MLMKTRKLFVCLFVGLSETHKGEILAGDEPLHAEELQDEVVAQERFGHDRVEGDDEDSLRWVCWDDDVVAHAAQSPRQVDAEDEEQVQPRVWVVRIVGQMHDDEQHVEDLQSDVGK
jgi:hypothetical protein